MNQDAKYLVGIDPSILEAKDYAIEKLQAENAELKKQKEEIIKYCSPHLDTMWAATIVGILLNCDFRDCKEAIAKIREAK